MFLTTIAVLALLAMIIMHVLKVGIVKVPKLPVISLTSSAVSPLDHTPSNVLVLGTHCVASAACKMGSPY